MSVRFFYALLCPLLFLSAIQGQPLQQGLRVPAGFEVREFAGSDLANDIYTLTVNPGGQVVVAGRGYIRILVDADKDGRAERAVEVSATPKDGAMGLLWEGDVLHAVGDGGLRKYQIGKDGKSTGPGELVRKVKTGGEHTAHALRRGPDGWLYLLCGDGAGIDRSFAQLATSPIRDPMGGCVLRFTPDLKKSEIVAHGFRNAYGMDFHPDGELFTWDSDNERCVSLPWYEPTRFYHVVPGGHYGWLAHQHAKWWRLPPYFLDVVPPVASLGRGSPTGVVCYRQGQFPAKYRGGFFCLDWTFGKVHFLKLRPEGSSYTAEKEVFLEATGENGFAPTGAVVHPETGDLYISIGGRGTRGAVYRIRYPAGLTDASRAQATALQPKARSLEWEPTKTADLLRLTRSGDKQERLRGLHLVERHRQQLSSAEVVAAIRASWTDPDRLVRQTSARLLGTLPEKERQQLEPATRNEAWLTWALAQPKVAMQQATVAALDHERTDLERLAALRIFQLGLGDIGAPGERNSVWAGYTPRQELREPWPRGLLDKHASWFGGDARGPLARELTRTLALLAVPADQAAAPLLLQLQRSDDPVTQLHYLIVLGRLSGQLPAHGTPVLADTLLGLDEALLKRGLTRDSNWPLRLSELYSELVRKAPDLNTALVEHPRFGRAQHALFALASGFDRVRAARALINRAKSDPEYPLNTDCVKVCQALPSAESLPVLRSLWGQAGLENAILPVLARSPVAADRGKFISGLKALDTATVRLCLEALQQLPGPATPEELFALLTALKRTPEKAVELRSALVRRLEQTSGQKLGSSEKAWLEWFTRAQPQLAARLANPDGVDLAAWARRLAQIDWKNGDSQRGRLVFSKAGCVACHGGGQALGPDLVGVGQRFSRQDLLTAILQPSKDISQRYQNWAIETTEGKIHQGLIIYDAVDSLILQTATATVRLAGEQVASRRPSPVSLMPAGLLDRLNDRDIADLLAFLGGKSAVSAGGR